MDRKPYNYKYNLNADVTSFKVTGKDQRGDGLMKFKKQSVL